MKVVRHHLLLLLLMLMFWIDFLRATQAMLSQANRCGSEAQTSQK
jgi:hypothetical protein